MSATTEQQQVDLPIGQIIRTVRQQLGLSQYALADQLAAVSGKPTMGRDRVARWERGSQVPRREWRQWLSAVLHVPTERLDAGAEAARRQNRLGHALVTASMPAQHGSTRRAQGTPALLPVFRSRVQAGILAATLLNPHRAFSLSELSEEAGGSLASVSKESKILEDAGILYTRYDGAIRLIRAATDKPILTPLTELIRITYGVPQVIGEEFSRVPGIARMALIGTWAERFAGVTGPEPECIHVRLTRQRDERPDDEDLAACARRARRRLGRMVKYTVVAPPSRPSAGSAPAAAHRGGTGRHTPSAGRLPRQRTRPRQGTVSAATALGNGIPVVHVAPQAAPDAMPPSADAWRTGADVISQMLADGQLELFSGPGAEIRSHLEVASHHLFAAEESMATSPESAFILASQSAHQVGIGLLAAQGLRQAPGSGDDVVGRAVVAQFGPQFRQLELLRQRVLALSDPTWRDNRIADIDIEGAVPAVRALLKSAQDIAIELNMFA